MHKEVKDYINNVLSEKRQEFNGKAVCPFAGPELAANKLMFGTVGEKSLEDLIDDFRNSDYNSAIFIIEEEISAKETKKFQMFVNRVLRKKGLEGYKNICFNPNDMVAIEGYNPRSLCPCFLVNIARSEDLSKAHRALRKTDYYDKMSGKYLHFLGIEDKS